MSLADHYDQANKQEPKPRVCKVCDWYRTLESRDRIFFDEKAEEALSGRGSMQQLRRAILSTGFYAARSTFQVHLNEHHRELLQELQT